MAAKHEIEVDEPESKRPRLENTDRTSNNQDEQERAVGIDVYVSPDKPGFSCIVKQRYTDFLVNEILPDGEVLHLKTLPDADPNKKSESKEPKAEVPPPAEKKEEPKPAPKEEKPKDNGPVAVPELSAEDRTAVENIFGAPTTERIIALHAAVLQHPTKKPRDHVTINSEVISEKSQRTQAHVVVRRVFNSKLETATLQELPGVISIKAAPPKGVTGARGKLDGNGAFTKGKVVWDELGGQYLHFTLHKENKDTMEVLYFMASQLKVHVKNFQFAGTKDRRGVTVQKVAIFRVQANRVLNLNKLARGWTASDFTYKKHGLELGELMGNEFTLTLRDCHFPDTVNLTGDERLQKARALTDAAADSFRSKGFLNYYGLQRFGTFSTGTHIVGMKMLKGDLGGAVDAILSYSPTLLEETTDTEKIPSDDINRAQAIKTWRETQTVPADTVMPKRFQAEASIMQYLSKRNKAGHLIQDKDFQGALMTIQRNLRLMYVHAYQSLIWNTVAGERWHTLGPQPVAGDLVIIGEKDDVGKPVQDEVDAETGEQVFHPAAHDSAQTSDDPFTRARPLTAEEAASGRYDIFDIVLPLPGFDVVYPSNAIGAFYQTYMSSAAGGELDPHNMRRAWKDISLSGGYRKMMSRPGKGFTASVQPYADDNAQLVATDLEKLKEAAGLQESVVATDAQGDKLAVVLKFQLGSSQYATMALRELTKGGARPFVAEFTAPR